jgi:Flp pilus assembly protein TadG
VRAYRSRQWWRNDRGSFALELAVLAPALIGLLWLMVSAGRMTDAASKVEGAARDAARAASINHAGRPWEAADHTARNSLQANGVSCIGGPTIQLSGNPVPGETVTVTVRCDVAILFGAGSSSVTRSASSVLDTFRGTD